MIACRWSSFSASNRFPMSAACSNLVRQLTNPEVEEPTQRVTHLLYRVRRP